MPIAPLPAVGAHRRETVGRLGAEAFDVVVVGGGITGAGVALAAAERGLSVALLEAGDFAAGTSSRSSKLIHGGLRYLAMGDVGLVRETALERAVVHGMAPHLAEPCWMVVPARNRASMLKLRTRDRHVREAGGGGAGRPAPQLGGVRPRRRGARPAP